MSEDGKEMTSLAGKAYCLNSDDNICLVNDEDDKKSSKKKSNRREIQVAVRSRDTYFTSNSKSFKRIFISNCLDQRHHDFDD